MKKLILLLVMTISGLGSKAQIVTNLHFDAELRYSTNYEFDINKASGLVINDFGYFKIDIEEDGKGRFYYFSRAANDGFGQKVIYKITKAEYRTYTDGSRFLNIDSYWEDGSIITVRVNFKTTRGKDYIQSIAMIGSTNEGTLHY